MEEGENTSKLKKLRIFLPDTIGTFFRRLCWSPDGLLLFTPCALYQESPDDLLTNTTYVWSRHDLTK